jgi:hypothetical protein
MMMRKPDRPCRICSLYHWRPARWYPRLCIEAQAEEIRQLRDRTARLGYWATRGKDLQVVVKDQQRHIASLEDQLRPHLVAHPVGKQETMLGP